MCDKALLHLNSCYCEVASNRTSRLYNGKVALTAFQWQIQHSLCDDMTCLGSSFIFRDVPCSNVMSPKCHFER